MNTSKIYIGKLICEKKEEGRRAFLKIGKRFAILDDINTHFDVLKLRVNRTSIPTFSTNSDNDCYVEEESLNPYYEKQGHKTLKKIKLDYLLDARNPSGINY